ncbi:MAG: 50S ribosomal protein L6 [Microgenomates group bacterium GW2011_GWC1_37_8]|uniref:Large ribosomal subunit protein uL6 n=1 Tax=Candidatus Woesebacteria bacterium GW2011_GWB1_38_8 TaxID=1618570 RepID=A0A0G0L4P9_9BACT|nr:MAG: 50S ribosomal protein L6 [Microgenomates group bacterium GW2011_GWC1_37_8]KKQ86007.1 MAG: 50S ribosomal protein L6 [Candidatus Woesebacteria bacterium GW2011_GWB1_38_8]
MSRIGKLPIELPEGVSIKVDGNRVFVTGPKGELAKNISKVVSVKKEGNRYVVSVNSKSKSARSIHGTTRAHIANMVNGVSVGFSKKLEMVGTGYRGEVSGRILSLAIGYSHPVKIEAPEGIIFSVEKSDITITGMDKEIVGEIAAKIRAIRPPEPYKGKGIKYKDEYIRRKAGKAAKTATAA